MSGDVSKCISVPKCSMTNHAVLFGSISGNVFIEGFGNTKSDDDLRSGCRNVSQSHLRNSPSQDNAHPDDHNLPRT